MLHSFLHLCVDTSQLFLNFVRVFFRLAFLRFSIFPWIFLFGIVHCDLAFAAPPFFTNDINMTLFKTWDLYLFVVYDRDPGFSRIFAPAIEIDYGVTPDFELHFTTFMLTSVPREPEYGVNASGLSDIELGFEYRLLSETKDRPQLAIFPVVQVPTGNAELGLGNGEPWYQLPLVIQKSWGSWTAFGQIGYAINNAPQQLSYWFGGAVVQHQFTDKFNLGLELRSQGAMAEIPGGGAYTLVSIGGEYQLPGCTFQFNVGNSIAGAQHLFGTFGLYWRIGEVPGKS